MDLNMETADVGRKLFRLFRYATAARGGMNFLESHFSMMNTVVQWQENATEN